VIEISKHDKIWGTISISVPYSNLGMHLYQCSKLDCFITQNLTLYLSVEINRRKAFVATLCRPTSFATRRPHLSTSHLGHVTTTTMATFRAAAAWRAQKRRAQQCPAILFSRSEIKLSVDDHALSEHNGSRPADLAPFYRPTAAVGRRLRRLRLVTWQR